MRSSRLRRRLCLLAVVAIVTSTAALVVPHVWVNEAQAELTGPKDLERIISYTVTRMLQKEHLSGRLMDDELSERTYDAFLETLDSMKVYFTQADVDEFRSERRRLDDAARRDGGNVAFAYRVFRRFLQRVDERVTVIDHWLGVEHDFTVDEEMITDGDTRVYAKSAEESRELWRKRIKYDLLRAMDDDKTEEEALESIRKRYHGFARRMKQTDSDELLEMFLTSLTMAYDPHSTYMSATSLEEFKIHLRLNLDGIGAQLSSEDETTAVTKIIPGGAADRDGRLKSKDQIIGVGQGESGEIVDVVGMKLKDVVKLIRGKRGSIVQLKVIPAGKTASKVYQITRDRIELAESAARGEIINERGAGGAMYKVGVIDLPSFYLDMDALRRGDRDYKSTTRDVKKILDGFRAKDVDAVVLDLRKNGGGSLTEAISLTGLFIDEGPVLQVKDAEGRVQALNDEDAGVAWDGALVVLTSKLSASASEILAGAVQDYRRGIVVGDHTTHGKGTVQSLVDLNRAFAFSSDRYPKLGSLKLTIQQFYRANGESTQERGVVSDVELPAMTTHMDVGESDLDHALKFDRVRPARYSVMNNVNPSMVERLKERSAARLASSEEFKKEIERIERYKRYKARKTISLNKEKFKAQRSELEADNKDEDDDTEKKDKTKVVKRDYYFNEAWRSPSTTSERCR